MKKYFGPWSFYKMVLAVAIPMMLQNLVTTSVNLVDSLMVGQLGDAAIGGVASVNRFYLIGSYGTMGMSAAAGIFIAQYFGAKNHQKMVESFRLSIVASYVIILPMFLIAFFFPEYILGFFTSDPQIIEVGVSYLRIACFSFLPIGCSLSISSAMRCIGETKIPLFVSVVSVLTNTCLNYVLIFGHFGFPQLGVVGAALATLLARCLELLILGLVLRFNDFPFETKMKDMFHISRDLTRQIISKAAPLCTNEILFGTGMAMILKLYGTRGGAVLSGYSICTTGADIFFTLLSGMSVATTVVVSHPLGANQLDKARENGYHMMGFSFVLAAVFSVLMFMTSYVFPSLYSTVSVEVMEIAQTMIRVQSVFFILVTLNMQNYFIVRAGGDTKSTLLMDSGFMWCVNITLLAILAYFTDVNIYLMYILGQSTDIIKLFLSNRLVRQEKWVVNLTGESA